MKKLIPVIFLLIGSLVGQMAAAGVVDSTESCTFGKGASQLTFQRRNSDLGWVDILNKKEAIVGFFMENSVSLENADVQLSTVKVQNEVISNYDDGCARGQTSKFEKVIMVKQLINEKKATRMGLKAGQSLTLSCESEDIEARDDCQ